MEIVQIQVVLRSAGKKIHSTAISAKVVFLEVHTSVYNSYCCLLTMVFYIMDVITYSIVYTPNKQAMVYETISEA